MISKENKEITMKTFTSCMMLIAAVFLSLNVNAAQQLYYIHSDHLNTPQALTDSNQQVVWRVEQQTPFGEVEVDEDPDGDGEDVVFNLRFPGQYFDEETNANYNYYRTYDPSLGRYIQSDPIGLGGGINTYAYVGGNPIKEDDPYGLACGTGLCVAIGLGAREIVKQTLKRVGKDAARQAARQQAANRAVGGPPGKCTPDEQRRLQDEVNRSCKGNGMQSCSLADSCPTLETKLALNMACALAREKINNRCFAGGDAGHRAAADSAWKSVQNCTSAIAAKECAPNENCNAPSSPF